MAKETSSKTTATIATSTKTAEPFMTEASSVKTVVVEAPKAKPTASSSTTTSPSSFLDPSNLVSLLLTYAVPILVSAAALVLLSDNARSFHKLWNHVALFLSHLSNSAASSAESALKSFLSGGVGGVCVVLVGHPLDLIKVRMQTAGAAGASASVVGMFTKTFRTEGVRGLYRGVSAPLTAVTPLFAVSFWGYDMGQRLVRAWYQTPVNAALTLPEKCWAGGFSAIPCTILMAPSERIKCLLQTNPGKYKGMGDCASQLYKQGGIASIYKGTALTLMRDIPGSIAWFGTYEAVKLAMMKAQGIDDMSRLSPVAVLTAGGFAGMACWISCIPFDVLKTRYQSAPEGTYKSVLDVYTQLMKNEGPGALFSGIRPALIRAFPANAACFMGMEVARKMLAFMD